VDNDIIAIQQLLYQYCHAVDRGSVGDILEVFHRDAVLRPVYLGHEIHKGRDAVRAWYSHYDTTVRAAVRNLRHKISCPYIELHGDEATAISYLDADFVDRNTGKMGLAAGRYEDKLIRDGGRWWIADRSIVVDGSVSLGQPSPL
jgi:ketosteroid isomerase-like protein